MDAERPRPVIEPASGGPGLQKTGKADPTLVVSLLFAVLSLAPTSWYGAAVGAEAFGPIVFPAILAIVAVMFGFIAFFRGLELADRVRKGLGLAAAFVGLFRLLVYPMLGW